MSVMSSWEQQQADKKKQTKTEMYKALAATAITKIEVEYDGSGDSGEVNSIVLLTDDGEEVSNEIIHDLVSDYIYAHLPGGWEINSGSYGTATIDVRKEKAHFDHNDRFETCEENPFDDEPEPEPEPEPKLDKELIAAVSKVRDHIDHYGKKWRNKHVGDVKITLNVLNDFLQNAQDSNFKSDFSDYIL
jgi:hypothetical protein